MTSLQIDARKPPAVIFLLCWTHEEFPHNGRRDIRQMHQICSEDQLQREIAWLYSRKVSFVSHRFVLDKSFEPNVGRP